MPLLQRLKLPIRPRTRSARFVPAAIVLALALFSAAPRAEQLFQLDGYAGLEVRAFTAQPADSFQSRHSWSLLAKPEFRARWDEGAQAAVFVPFFRWDSADSERTHWDIRELYWERRGESWDVRVGLDRVFWGVIESQHLVDFVNQTDLVENLDSEDKLGQPMVNLNVSGQWGALELFVLPGFRERTFPGRRGRLRTQPFVDTTQTSYESSLGQAHVDFAARWSQVLEDWDVGLYHFYGTSRDPTLLPGVDARRRRVLRPHYELVHQSGLDVQVTQDNLMWKLEAIHRSGQGDSFVATSVGVEYTLVGVLQTQADLGLLAEYHFDSEGDGNALHLADDWFAGLRFSANDVQSTEILPGVLVDRVDHGNLLSIEASRRLGDVWKAEFEARLFSNFDSSEPLAQLQNDDYVQFTLLRHF